ncbi:cytochrome c1 [Thiohalobacter sp. IOR34]|uniref:cytochrome c1 n=1 Tax=Thiohalobacter sp. IOR34 TaxID=3057176 RepID=UPI0025B24DC3|nr:cytochrome c1 [Thiohalobacter sp. IOR34]WJW74837.1 cytochrome c1 [Thiohalobacter sp. IOR34]
MKKAILTFVLALMPALGMASGGGIHLDEADIDVSNQQSLQRGARLFVNYCLSCHSAQYQRYNRMARDLGLTDQQVIDNLMFAGEKVGELMTIAMPPAQAEEWFGAPPPDLTLVARARGVDWLYTYLRTFYIDESRPFGVNNLVFESVGMPHVLWELQGLQKAVFRTETDHEGNEHQVFDHFETVKEGKMSPTEYDQAMRDLVAFMSYMAEPVQLERQRLGIWVMLYLAIFFVVAYMLKKEYWKDVH